MMCAQRTREHTFVLLFTRKQFKKCVLFFKSHIYTNSVIYFNTLLFTVTRKYISLTLVLSRILLYYN